MRRVLLTGMSGVGKSSVVRELAARGLKAVDADDGLCTVQPDGSQRWDEPAVQALLDTEDADVLFLAGCEENQVGFHPQFDAIVLLSAPADVLLDRLVRRTGNPFGKTPEQRRRVLADLAEVEPLLRRAASAEVVMTAPLADVVTTVLRLVEA